MEPEVLAALVGVPATVLAAAIAYPVGRGVAKRQAADQHEQWLRTERRTASQALADASTGFIEASTTVWEAVVRPDYAHTRRRDIEARKRLDPALYEPLKKGLTALHNALPAVALHGPEKVTIAGQDLYDSALATVGEILRLDVTSVQRSLLAHLQTQQGISRQRADAAIEDLDTAYARLAAPFGLPEFATDVTDGLNGTALLAAFIRLMSAFEDPSLLPGAVADLRAAVDADAEFGPMMEPVLQIAPLIEMHQLVEPGRQGLVPEHVMMGAVQAGLPVLINMLSSFQNDMESISLPIDLADADPAELEAFGFTKLLQEIEANAGDLKEPLQALTELQQYIAMGDELLATAANTGISPFLACNAWVQGLNGMMQRNHLSQLGAVAAQNPLMTGTLDSIFTRVIDASNAKVRQAREDLIQARINFIDEVRDAIGST